MDNRALIKKKIYIQREEGLGDYWNTCGISWWRCQKIGINKSLEFSKGGGQTKDTDTLESQICKERLNPYVEGRAWRSHRERKRRPGNSRRGAPTLKDLSKKED